MDNIDKIIRNYVNAAINYGKAQDEGDSKKVNKYAAIIRKIRIELKRESQIGVMILEPLLKHENAYVRLKVAFDLLPIMTKDAIISLEELSDEKGLLGFEAEMLLKEWRKGNIMP